jgi:hypothetical protein
MSNGETNARREREVIVVYDGTRASRLALDVACELAAPQRGLQVVVATRRSPRYGETMAEAEEGFSRADRAARRLRNEVEAYCQERGLTARVTVRPGRARAEFRRVMRASGQHVLVTAGGTGILGFRSSLAGRRARHGPIAVFLPVPSRQRRRDD